jgi:hypothetical protein
MGTIVAYFFVGLILPAIVSIAVLITLKARPHHSGKSVVVAWAGCAIALGLFLLPFAGLGVVVSVVWFPLAPLLLTPFVADRLRP